VAENLAGLLRNPTCALHVHVSMPDPETAVRVYNAIRVDAPLLLALSANSPFWHGIDSGLASARTAIVRSYPRGGMARAFRDYEDFLSTARSLADVAEVEDYTYFWWDVRLQPRFGTVEVRIMDAQTSLDLTTGLIALVHGLAADALWHPREVRLHDEVLQESSYRAARYGMDGRLPDAEGRLRPVPELARDAIARVRPFLRERGGHEALAHIEDALIHGNGAVRQRAAYARGGTRAVTEQLARESSATPQLRRAPDEPGPFVQHRRVSR
jgi:carboxylate-amine ligase